MQSGLKKVISVGFTAALALTLAAWGSNHASAKTTKTTTVKVGIVGADKRIWDAVDKKVQKDHIKIKVVEFSDYNKPNSALQDGDIDLNAFQHQYFLDNWNKTHHGNLVAIGKTVLAPLAVYSQKIKGLKQLKKGDTVSVPNDPTNEGRALQLLEAAGLIKLDNKDLPTTQDIKSSPKGIKVEAIDAAQLPKSLPDVAASVINSGVAVDAKLNPEKAIYREPITKKSKPWINIIVANNKDKNKKAYKQIVKAYQTKSIAKLIKKIYKSTETPAWNYKF